LEEDKTDVRNIVGMKLTYPNPFTAQLKKRMPQLFVTNKDDKFNTYSRMCPFTATSKRQPIILTKEEKEQMLLDYPEINQESDFIEYNASPNTNSNPYYFTCPRYWCLLTNKMITEKDILAGKCGKKVTKVEDAIIPQKSKVVPKDKYVFEFYDKNEKLYPGFHNNKTKDGLCIPCCFSNWNTSTMKERRDLCQGKKGKEDTKEKEGEEDTNQRVEERKGEGEERKEGEREEEEGVEKEERKGQGEGVEERKRVEERKGVEEEKEDVTNIKKIEKNILKMDQYVKGPEKYGPQLGEYRWGFLPVAIEKFLHQVNEECQISKTNTVLKLNHLCILRLGVEVNEMQSFIACISSAVFYANKELIQQFFSNKSTVPTIKEMKELIIRSLNLDNFIKYQNGDLITSFSNPDITVDIEDYNTSKLYKNMLKQNPEEQVITKEFIIKVIQAFENFKLYLSNDSINIDYTYLWDIVCMPNPYIFKSGINLIILEIPENDVTNNVELVCPTNHYSNNIYDARKRTLFLIKRENFFEPIYGYFNDGKHINVKKTFSEYDKTLSPTLKDVFNKIIKPTLGEKCKSFVSRPNIYKFKQPPLLDNLINMLIAKGFKVKTQVLNFQGKVIGVFAKNRTGLEGFIPCYPSSITTLQRKTKSKSKSNDNIEIIIKDYNFVYMNDNLWKSYEDTLVFLKDYYNYEEPKDIHTANCYNPNYFCRVVEDELITGFLTNTNQFVPIHTPIPVSTVDDGIKTITTNDMLVADTNTLTNKNVDTDRIHFIKSIQLETHFYNIFRNTIRVLLNDYLNIKLRQKIKNECNKKNILYNTQLQTVIQLLHKLVANTIIFVEELGYNYLNINEKELYTCITKSIDKCDTQSDESICRLIDGKTCQLILPKTNLVSHINNEEFYYGRMADELIRYNRIKSFVFKPNMFLSFGKLGYNLRDDEIIILHDLLNNDFFENLVAININSFAKYNTYDTAEPILTQAYDREIVMDEDTDAKHYNTTCNKIPMAKITSIYWKSCFPNTYTEIKYSGSNECALHLIQNLVNEYKNIDLSIIQIKKELFKIYKSLTENFKNQEILNKIIDILNEESQIDTNKLKNKTLSFKQMIYNIKFIPINFDLWILLEHFKIPSIFISSKVIPESRFTSRSFVCYTEEDINTYAFIITQPMYDRSGYKKTANDELNIPIYKLVVDDNKEWKINLQVLHKTPGLNDITSSINKYYNIHTYLDSIFSKHNITYKPKQKKPKKGQDKDEHVIKNEDDDEDEDDDEEKDKVKDCPPTKELNPKTNRCVNKCTDGKVRDENFKCVKKYKNKLVLEFDDDELEKKINTNTNTNANVCPPSKELNPKTNRCVNKCVDGKVRDENFKCVTIKKQKSNYNKTKKL
jgi:hypothetical protein